MEALMGQLGDSAEFSDLKQKVSKIEKSKVKLNVLVNNPIDKSFCRITQNPAW